jgi:hypothetical protein
MPVNQDGKPCGSLLSDEQITQIKETYVECGIKAEVARRLGISRTVVHRVLRDVEAPKSRTKSPDDNNDDVIRDRNAMLEQRVKDLERALTATKKEAVTAKTVREYILGLKAHEPPKATRIRKSKKEFDRDSGTPALFLSDLHWGEKVNPNEVFNLNQYDLAEARRRLHYVVRKAVRIDKNLLRDVKLVPTGWKRRFVLVLGGDMVSGDIHEDLKVTNEREIMPVVLDCVDNLVDVMHYLSAEYDEVMVHGVPGNHGRNTMKPRMKFYAETNFDWLIYQLVQRGSRHLGNVFFNIPPVRDLTFEIEGRRFRLSHGDQFKGGDGIIGAIGPVTRGDKRKRASASTMPGAPEMYDTLMVGHFHSYLARPTLIMNGTMKGYDELSMGWGFDFEPPQQAFICVHPRVGINYYMPLIADPDYGK